MTKTKNEVLLGDYHYHSVYGVGTVVAVSPNRTVVRYKGGTQISVPTSLVEVISEEDAVMYKLKSNR